MSSLSRSGSSASSPNRSVAQGLLLVAGILSGIIPVVQYKDDAQFLKNVTNPELPKLIEAIYKIKAPAEPWPETRSGTRRRENRSP